ncbi:serine protease [Streptomyces sp. NPDC051920]|uniref:trypsin-like serine peptidase n=1 Tax=Streptomyces sp. NPDC051920 TaxID=3155523 RepID=UPI003435CF7D
MATEGNAPLTDIARRWAKSRTDLPTVTAALRKGDVSTANEPAEIDQRRARLAAHGTELEAVIGEDDSLWLGFLSRGLLMARAVVRVVTLPVRSPAVPEGTGVLVSPRVLLTNHHVVPDAEHAAPMGVQVGYEYGDDGGELACTTIRLAPETLFFTAPVSTLDFTVVALAEEAPENTGYVPLIEAGGKVLIAEPLNVIHHPGGERKQVSIRNNRLVSQDEKWLRYTSDTRHGSSGAPVFNDQWEMVALHHGGIPARDAEGRRLTRTSEVWTPDMDEEAVAYQWNEGARVSRIVRRLRTAALPKPQRVLLDEALSKGVRS